MKAGIKTGTATLSIIAAIIYTAISYVGYEEKPNNSGFQSAVFEKEMRSVGWHKYDAWCVYFCKLVWHKSIADSAVNTTAMKLITGNSQRTLANFVRDTSGYFGITDTAFPGSIVIWRTYKNGKGYYSGHAGIVTSNNPSYFNTVEGNTNNAGGSEGYIVSKNKRKYSRDTQNGLRLMKFIKIKKVS